jgi:RNA polymerase sigma factor (sigma-70 family)
LTKKHEIKTLVDEELVKAYCEDGGNQYIQALFDRYLRFVFLVCMKYLKNEEEARDMAMLVFEKALVDIKRFEIQNFKSWLHVVTKNACLMELRKNKGIRVTIVAEEKELEKNMENGFVLHPEQDNNHDLKLDQLEKAIALLDNEQRQCIELFYLKEKSYNEVANITGFSVNQVKSSVQNGKRNLKNMLSNNGNILLYVLVSLYLNK